MDMELNLNPFLSFNQAGIQISLHNKLYAKYHFYIFSFSNNVSLLLPYCYYYLCSLQL